MLTLILISRNFCYSPAGSTDFAYSFETVSSDQASAGTQLGIGSTHLKNNGRLPETEFGAQLQMMVPVILGLLLVLIAVAGFAVCIKRSKLVGKLYIFGFTCDFTKENEN